MDLIICVYAPVYPASCSCVFQYSPGHQGVLDLGDGWDADLGVVLSS